MKPRNTMRAKHLSLVLLVAAPVGTLTAQDNHLSQYDAAPMQLNPALTGVFDEAEFRVATNIRSQWSSIGSNFLTTGFSYDLAAPNRFGVGAYLNNYDMAGVMNTFQFGLSGSYNVSSENAPHSLSVGLNAGLIYKKVKDEDLLFDQQYNDGYFDPDLPSGETFPRMSRLMPELAVGFAYRSKNQRHRVNPFANFAAYHVTMPDESLFRTERSPLAIRWSLMGGTIIDIGEVLRITPMGQLMVQRNDREINMGVLSELSIGGSVYRAVFGVSYRWQDAAIVHAGLRHKNNMYRFSYDMPVSGLNNYTRLNGAFEFSVVYYGIHSGRERRVLSKSF
ncbi:MAG: PorP/SprF family type IX secretion system membrane protein [Flavobacteriales bacterium]|nr:PorP/SprF family type IX secretion system membrane protein [Flavobacteriales bacterium]MCB9167105.1 PorP/SprF family type IX secretion system membrane protein [Flavobacteriales bacterium]